MLTRQRAVAALIIACVFAPFAVAADAPHPAKMDGAIPIEPDPVLTPGDINPALTQAVLCAKDFATPKYRHVTESDKVAAYLRYGMIVPKDSRGHYNFHVGYCATKEGCEVDHDLSIENGGANSPLNLWVQPYSGTIWSAHAKDILENRLHRLVCVAKSIDLADDQRVLRTDWIAGWFKYVSPLPPTPAGTIDPKTPKGYGD